MPAPNEDDLRRNAILGALPENEFSRFAERVEILEVEMRQSVYEPDQSITEVYFPLTAVFSVVAVADRRVTVEVATIGREGMVGLPLFLGAHTSPHEAFCQIPGSAARLSGHDLGAMVNGDTQLRRVLNRFTEALIVQIAQNVVCNNAHNVDQRMCRWLLATHDRVGRDEFAITQDFLAQMLGVRRPTVSATAQGLQSRGLVRYSRGTLSIVDRPGLEGGACQCYALIKAQFDAAYSMSEGR